MTDHKNIYAALAAAQAAMEGAKRDAKNDAFKRDGKATPYATLASVIEACMPALNANGIAVYQPTVDEDGNRYVKTVLAHTSGETLECRVPLIVQKNDMQGYGSAVTYARRYGLMGMAGIAPEDDDGNAAAKAAPVVEKPAIRPELQHGEAIRDAWRDSVLDRLPEDATPRQKAEAFAKAIADDFKGKGEKALHNAWARHAKLIERLQQDHPDLHEMIGDAFDTRLNDLTDSKGIAAQ